MTPNSETTLSLSFLIWPNEMSESFSIKKRKADPANHMHIIQCGAHIQHQLRKVLPGSFVHLTCHMLHHTNNYFRNSHCLWSVLAPIAESGDHPASYPKQVLGSPTEYSVVCSIPRKIQCKSKTSKDLQPGCGEINLDGKGKY